MKKYIITKSLLFVTFFALCISTNGISQNFGNVNLDSVNALKDQFIDFKNITNALSNQVSQTLADSNFITKTQLDSLQNQISFIQSHQDSIVKLIADSTKITADSLNALKNQASTLLGKQDSLVNILVSNTGLNADSLKQLTQTINDFQANQDSLVKLIADSTNISSDSLIALKNQLDNLQQQQDSITNIIIANNDLNKDSLLALSDQLAIIQHKNDSIANVFLNNISNFNTFNQDTLDKAKSQLDLLQKQLNEAINVVINTGIQESSVATFSIYPIPCHDYLTISSSEIIKTVSIYNLNGNLSATFGTLNTYNLSAIAAGVYVIKIEFNNSTATQKLIID